MMKKVRSFMFAAMALIALASCSKEEGSKVENNDSNGPANDEYDEAYYAANATVSSSDANFTAEGDGWAVRFDAGGGTVVVNVSCGTSWTAENNATDIFTAAVDQAAGTVTLTAGENASEEELSGTLTLLTTGSRIVFATVSMIQDAAEAPEIDLDGDMILVYTINSIGMQVTLPLTGTVDCTVDWGDGSAQESVSSSYPTHTYATPGEYEVHIAGTVTALNSNDSAVATRDAKNITLTAVRQWGHTGLTSMKYAFAYCAGLASVPADDSASFADVTDCKGLFVYCTSLTELPAGIFAYCSKNKDFTQLFYSCTSLKALPEGLFDSCTEVTSYQGAFYGCTALTEVPAGLFDSGSKITDLSRVFQNCSALTTVPAGIFDNCTQNTTFRSSFYKCSSLKSLPDGIFDNCGEVQTFYMTFYMCTSLTSLPSAMFKGCVKATEFYYVFYGCTGLTRIPSDLFSGCSAATDLSYAFYVCTYLASIPSGLFDDCVNAQTFEGTFEMCLNVTSIPSGLFDKCTEVTNFASVFENTHITRIPDGLFDNCPKVTDMTEAFYSSYLTTIPSGLFDKCVNLTSIKGMFNRNSYLTTIPEGLFDNCPEITDVSYAFRSTACTSFPADLLDKCRKVTVFDAAFGECTSVGGESPYSELTVDGETVKVHLYERADYPDEFATPLSYSFCFTNSPGLTDYYDMPEGWRGDPLGSISAVGSSRDGGHEEKVPAEDESLYVL